MAVAMALPKRAEREIELTIGMATYNDFDGVYFTLQALRLYQDLEQTELLVIDNYGCHAYTKSGRRVAGRTLYPGHGCRWDRRAT